MSVSRRTNGHTAFCQGCGQATMRLVSIFISGAGWFDFCASCDDECEHSGAARAYTGPFPIPAGAE